MPRSLDLYFRDEYQATITADDSGSRLKVTGPGAARARSVLRYYEAQSQQTGADLLQLVKDRVRGLHWWTAEQEGEGQKMGEPEPPYTPEVGHDVIVHHPGHPLHNTMGHVTHVYGGGNAMVRPDPGKDGQHQDVRPFILPGSSLRRHRTPGDRFEALDMAEQPNDRNFGKAQTSSQAGNYQRQADNEAAAARAQQPQETPPVEQPHETPEGQEYHARDPLHDYVSKADLSHPQDRAELADGLGRTLDRFRLVALNIQENCIADTQVQIVQPDLWN